jgi:hypothetical protein
MQAYYAQVSTLCITVCGQWEFNAAARYHFLTLHHFLTFEGLAREGKSNMRLFFFTRIPVIAR